MASLVLIAAAIAVLAFALTRPDSGALTKGGASPSSGASPTPGFAAFTIANRAPTAEEQRLLGYVPEAMRSGCGPLDSKADLAVGAVGCRDGEQWIVYTLFPTRTTMDRRFDLSVKAIGAQPGDCATER